MSASLVGGITQILTGKKNLSKGVKVEMGENSAVIDLFVVVEYGVKIQEIAVQVQSNVKKAVETMTCLSVSAVNVHVQNVLIPKLDEKNEETEE